MRKSLELLNKITAPLIFAASDDWRRLPLIRDLEKVMEKLAAQLRNELSRTFPPACPNSNVPFWKQILEEFEETFRDFDRLPLNEKVKRIEKARLQMQRIEQEISSTAPETTLPLSPERLPLLSAAIVRNEQEFPDLLHMRTCFALLSRPVASLKGVGPRTAFLLNKKGLLTIEDLIYFLPRCYEDRRFPASISQARVGFRETIVGTVRHAETKFYGKKPVYEATISDDTGLLKAKWFKGNPVYLKTIFKEGNRVILTGEIGQYALQKEMVHPDFEILDKESDNLLHFKRIVPVYSETEGLHQKNLRRIMKGVVDEYSSYVLSPIPEDICRRHQLMDIAEAVRQAHFPALDQNMADYNSGRTAAHRRLIFDEFFFFQLGMALKRKGQNTEAGFAFKTGGKRLVDFYRLLPFPLTDAQRQVIGEIEKDMAKACPMNRLLQGDVGCGKTVVAMAAMITACDNGCQSAMMAPTEILAEQHYKNIKNWTESLHINVVLLTGKMSAGQKNEIYGQIQEGKAQIITGTHALIQEGILFHKLGLAVIDEQHRFGVVQRAALRGKGANPDILIMTATPIPRTLAMTVYGDLDISVIDEMPPGKKPVHTKVLTERNRNKVYEYIRNEIKKGHQVFVVYPLVEESEHLDMKDATRMAEHLQKEIFPESCVGLIHGKMKRTEKEEIMSAFVGKKVDILVATTVIEVGIDIPQASLMVIEHAERFGLSQLHQLRGRVGRSDIPSTCVLLAGNTGSEDARRRLRIMEKTNDGFLIAEEDLSLRGPGEFMGTRQSGIPDFRIANLIRDGKLLNEAKESAFSLVENDPLLEKPEHRNLKEVLMKRWEGRLDLAHTG
jgi:ATP-dependent DNA helicase RecG